MYRIQLYDDRDARGMHMQIGKGGGFHLAEAEARGEALPVNVFVGGPPALILAAIAPLPENVPELLLASLLLGGKLASRCGDRRVGRCRSSPTPSSRSSARSPPSARRPEGPFGDHYGYYSQQHDYPVLQCKALLHRRDAIFPATVVGKPRQEDFFLGDYLQELLSPLFPLVMPAVRRSVELRRDRLPLARRRGRARALQARGDGERVPDPRRGPALADEVPARDRTRSRPARLPPVLEHVLERADFRTDLFVFANLSMDSLDYAGPRINEGSKGVLLGSAIRSASCPASSTARRRRTSRRARVVLRPAASSSRARRTPSDRGAAARIARSGVRRLAAARARRRRRARRARARSTSCGRRSRASTRRPTSTRAARELVATTTSSFTPPIVIDARMKPSYPEELFCDETAALVTGAGRSTSRRRRDGRFDRGHLD